MFNVMGFGSLAAEPGCNYLGWLLHGPEVYFVAVFVITFNNEHAPDSQPAELMS